MWVACSNLNTIEYAAAHGIGALGFQFASPDGARAWVNRYYNIISSDKVEKLCEYETNPNLAIVSGFMCAETDEEARAKADGWTFSSSACNIGLPTPTNLAPLIFGANIKIGKIPRKPKKAFDSGLIGSPDTIRRKLREYADANIDQIILLNQ